MERAAGKVKIESIVRSEIGFTNNDPRVEASLVHFIKKYGQLKPVVVRQHTDKLYPLEAIEGRKVFAACVMAGLKEIFVLKVGKVSDVEAEEINLSLNGITFEPNYVRLSSTINRVYPGKSVDELIHMLPFPSDDIKDFLELEKFHWSQFQPTGKNKSEDQFSMHDTMFNEDDN